MIPLRRLAFSWAAIGFAASLAPAQTLPSLENAAGRLQAATVTIRAAALPEEATPPTDAGGAKTPSANAPDANAPSGTGPAVARVSIFSGVFVGKGLVATHVDAAVRMRFRLTLPGGQRIDARLAVLDEYSGLALLEAQGENLPELALAEELPKAGAWIMSAAGWGAESPAVSLGVVGARDRILSGGRFPPLLQCDLQTASTSRGAGVVDCEGRLAGVVVAVENVEGRRGWTYAVPVRHVQRLIRAHEERKAGESVVVLKRRRPVVGLVLAGSPDDAERVLVERVAAGGPAADAGLRQGDRVIAADGLNIRSVYEAQRAVLQKQPGDKVVFLINRQGREHTVEVVLGGGVEMPAPPPDQNIADWVRPQLDVEGLGQGRFRTQDGQGEVREVFAPGAPQVEDDELRPRTPAEQISLLQKALDRYREAIVYLKNEVVRREQDRLEDQRRLEQLQREIEQLERRLK